MEDCKTDLSIALSWAFSANNSLRNVNGFSPNQLSFGSNSKLQNNMDSKLEACEGKTSSEIVAKNLTARYSAWKAFIKSESAQTIRRALRNHT